MCDECAASLLACSSFIVLVCLVGVCSCSLLLAPKRMQEQREREAARPAGYGYGYGYGYGRGVSVYSSSSSSSSRRRSTKRVLIPRSGSCPQCRSAIEWRDVVKSAKSGPSSSAASASSSSAPAPAPASSAASASSTSSRYRYDGPAPSKAEREQLRRPPVQCGCENEACTVGRLCSTVSHFLSVPSVHACACHSNV